METYRTNDLSLVAFLDMEGHVYQSMEPTPGNPRKVVWVFVVTGNLMELIDEYQTEPDGFRDFSKARDRIQRSMYDFRDGLGAHA